MRYAAVLALSLTLALAGCLAVQEPHDPTARPSAAPVTSEAAPAPVQSKAPATASGPEEQTLSDVRKEFEALSTVEKMKQLFTLKKTLEKQFMELAPTLSVEELAELNAWLEQHGIQLHRKCQNPNHDHSGGGPDDQEEDEQRQEDGSQRGEVF